MATKTKIVEFDFPGGGDDSPGVDDLFGIDDPTFFTSPHEVVTAADAAAEPSPANAESHPPSGRSAREKNRAPVRASARSVRIQPLVAAGALILVIAATSVAVLGPRNGEKPRTAAPSQTTVVTAPVSVPRVHKSSVPAEPPPKKTRRAKPEKKRAPKRRAKARKPQARVEKQRAPVPAAPAAPPPKSTGGYDTEFAIERFGQ